jgi:MoaA/NifB/PqqE/SkfB family radical SAM enzyme
MKKNLIDIELQNYLIKGVERIVADAVLATIKNPRESAFMVRFATASRAAAARRKKAEEAGEHIPPFLIASITSQCNLHCAGCYSRCNNTTSDSEPEGQLTSEEWEQVFKEADELGISFILLAGGEPMMRRDVLEAACKEKNILFPVFTNGTFMDEKYFEMFDRSRNIIPILSIEGEQEMTDARRGDGVYDILISNMEELYQRGVVFGTSVTVTKENIREVCSDAFLGKLSDKGCKVVIFVEYVPVSDAADDITPGEAEREYLRAEIARLRKERPEMVYISFPGDEKSSGGCLAAGRGFFHINPYGGAEPCPFSPYSDISVKETSLKEALESRLFTSLRNSDILMDDHEGGCVLYEKRKQVEDLFY